MPNKMRYKNINRIGCETFACKADRKQFCFLRHKLFYRVLERSMAHSHLTQLAPLTEKPGALTAKK